MKTIQTAILTLYSLAMGCCSSPCAFAQVDVKESYATNEPILILVDAPAEPEVSQALTVDLDGPGSYRQVKMIDDTGKPRVGLFVANQPGEYTYRIECVLTETIDFNGRKLKVLLDGGFVRKGRFTVVSSGPPGPGPGPGPDGPDDASLSDVAKQSRAALQAFCASLAANCSTISANAKAGKYRNVSAAGAESNKLDSASRDVFLQSMNGIMQPRLGSTTLPADAWQTFEDIATGFRGVK